ncbi:alpha-keto acid decarboxylase family protein [Asaia siamensis]|uniref:Indole-3-pyruvate decarboxylase n=1 Tax=Asaia siamensis TaxID=110479 RepID=A0ABQ1LFG9_9PROT|nr:thiamine pyrophosphate-binding protein [Asaia siamensis]GBR08033.1 indole-3-pyruvate decarboxylase [Asaia siamensis NRIC 0323]GGC23774.1 indole-3-pyruvate decarboxylase [Asaia siamensis]
MSSTVIEHLLDRLAALGIDHVFGVAGDYAFPIEDAVCARDDMRWVGSCNELNAAYSADGYARMKGMAALSTTYGVGELSALNGIAGAFAEHLPLIHIVGMPASAVMTSDRLVHHSLGNGTFMAFYEACAAFTCARAILTPENCVDEIDKALAALKTHRRPIYFGIPSDHAGAEAKPATPVPVAVPARDDARLALVVERITAKLQASSQSCILPGNLCDRFGALALAREFIRQSGLPHATMFADKGMALESSPLYLGLYYGHLLHENIASFVEASEVILGIGVQLSDFNTGAFTARLPEERLINILPDHVVIGGERIDGVAMADILQGLIAACTNLPRFGGTVPHQKLPEASDGAALSSGTLYHDIQTLLQPSDIVAAETGNASMGLSEIRLPDGCAYHNQTLWGSIGWATPAAFGMAMAEPDRRVVLVTGEGSHQLTTQELSQFARFGRKPVVLIINNDGYLIERLLCADGETYYNDLAQWRYSLLPEAFGCHDWVVSSVSTREALLAAFEACNTDTHRAHFIEIKMKRYDAAPVAMALHGAIDTLYDS